MKPTRICHYSFVRRAFYCLLVLTSLPGLSVMARREVVAASERQGHARSRLASGTVSVNVPFDLFGNNILVQIRN